MNRGPAGERGRSSPKAGEQPTSRTLASRFAESSPLAQQRPAGQPRSGCARQLEAARLAAGTGASAVQPCLPLRAAAAATVHLPCRLCAGKTGAHGACSAKLRAAGVRPEHAFDCTRHTAPRAGAPPGSAQLQQLQQLQQGLRGHAAARAPLQPPREHSNGGSAPPQPGVANGRTARAPSQGSTEVAGRQQSFLRHDIISNSLYEVSACAISFLRSLQQTDCSWIWRVPVCPGSSLPESGSSPTQIQPPWYSLVSGAGDLVHAQAGTLDLIRVCRAAGWQPRQSATMQPCTRTTAPRLRLKRRQRSWQGLLLRLRRLLLQPGSAPPCPGKLSRQRCPADR